MDYLFLWHSPTVLAGDPCSEYRIRKSNLIAKPFDEGNVTTIDICRSPSKGPRVQRDDEGFVALTLGSAEERLGN